MGHNAIVRPAHDEESKYDNTNQQQSITMAAQAVHEEEDTDMVDSSDDLIAME